MTIELPEDLEGPLRSLVRIGRFATVDEAMGEAVRLLLRQPPPTRPPLGRPMTEEEFMRDLFETGKISQIPDPSLDEDDDDIEPIDIEGEPLSETIIRERG